MLAASLGPCLPASASDPSLATAVSLPKVLTSRISRTPALSTRILCTCTVVAWRFFLPLFLASFGRAGVPFARTAMAFRATGARPCRIAAGSGSPSIACTSRLTLLPLSSVEGGTGTEPSEEEVRRCCATERQQERLVG